MTVSLFSRILLFIGIVLSLSVHAEHKLTPKLGYIDWEKNTVNVAGTDINYKRGSFLPIGVSYGYILGDALLLGGEFIYEDLDLTDGRYSNSNDINVYRLNALLNYYFLPGDSFKPYIGLGIGYASVGIHAAENAKLQGYTYMGIAGFDMQFTQRIGLNLEYRDAYISVDDSSQNQLKSRNNEYFIGINIHFGN